MLQRKVMAKKYMAISNWDEFPNLKGLYIDRGNMHRTFCRCGYVHTEHVSECRNCGNKSFATYYNDRFYEYTIIQASSGMFNRKQIYYTIDYNNQESTKIVTHERSEGLYLRAANIDFEEEVAAMPELFKVKPYALAKETFEYLCENHGLKKNSSYDYYYNSNWRTIVMFCEKFARESKNADLESILYLMSLIGSDNFLAKLEKISNSHKSVIAIINNFEQRNGLVMSLAKDLRIFSILIDNPTVYDSIDPEIGNLIAAYYSEGYISDIKSLVDLVNDIHFTPLKRFMFERFFKEKYSDLGYACTEIKNMMEWIAMGHHFDNAKDYYMQRNKEIFCKAYSTDKYDAALLDVYNHPAEAIINLANLK